MNHEPQTMNLKSQTQQGSRDVAEREVPLGSSEVAVSKANPESSSLHPRLLILNPKK
jgi:hypothetical protein